MKKIESEKCITYVEETNVTGLTKFSVHPKSYVNSFDMWLSCTQEVSENIAKVINDNMSKMFTELKEWKV